MTATNYTIGQRIKKWKEHPSLNPSSGTVAGTVKGFFLGDPIVLLDEPLEDGTQALVTYDDWIQSTE